MVGAQAITPRVVAISGDNAFEQMRTSKRTIERGEGKRCSIGDRGEAIEESGDARSFLIGTIGTIGTLAVQGKWASAVPGKRSQGNLLRTNHIYELR